MKSNGAWTAKCAQLAGELERHEASLEDYFFDNRSYYCHQIVLHGEELMSTLAELDLPFSTVSLQGTIDYVAAPH